MDDQLSQRISSLGLTGNPLPAGFQPSPKPDDSALTKLGEALFFSKSLSLGFDSSCASCHYPAVDTGMGDGLSLGVGTNALDVNEIGVLRRVDVNKDLDPGKDGLANVPRNSQSVFNTALFVRTLFWDGRVEKLGSGIRTPDSVNTVDPDAGDTLLAAQSIFPLVSPNEMRGYSHIELATSGDVRGYLVERLKGGVDQARVSSADASAWLTLFQGAAQELGVLGTTADDLITMPHIAAAIDAYESSLVFVDSPWKAYVDGDETAISDTAKLGALRFLTPLGQPVFADQPSGPKGLGCAACHKGDLFSDEKFYNLGFPQIGRGKLADHQDWGRYDVTQNSVDKYRFRTPTLLNVEATKPYGHAGTFVTLDALLQYHANPVAGLQGFDFGLSQLPQYNNEQLQYCTNDGKKLPFGSAGADFFAPYCYGKIYTQDAQNYTNFVQDTAALPRRNLSQDELTDLEAFLQSLTDPCVQSDVCLSAWVPEEAANDDPDGNMLTRGLMSPDESAGYQADASTTAGSYAPVPLTIPSGLPTLTAFADASSSCAAQNHVNASLAGQDKFTLVSDSSSGLVAPHGFTLDAWLGATWGTLQAGGVAAAYLDGDCWPDILYLGGDASGVVGYIGNGSGVFTKNSSLFPAGLGARYISAGVADINGDYRRELFLGNLILGGKTTVLAQDAVGKYEVAASLPMGRNTFGFAFGDMGNQGKGQGRLSVAMAHWTVTSSVPGSAPAFFEFDGSQLVPIDGQVGLGTGDGINQPLQFAPGFADFNADGWQDLAIASDFGTSVVMQNVVNPKAGAVHPRSFENVTNKAVVKDQNGMGSAIADYDNDGKLDWFVSAIHQADPDDQVYKGNLGNRLYHNVTSDGGKITFTDITDAAGVANSAWAWGSCAADFNNDGWPDIFVENGYDYFPDAIYNAAPDSFKQQIDQERVVNGQFESTQASLFINQGASGAKNQFVNEASAWGVEPHTNGRGVACFDYDRDGAVDIAVLDQSRGLILYHNTSGTGAGHHFLNVRLVGKSPNTDALGAKIYVTADLQGDGDVTQLQQSAANSNFASQNLPDLHFGLGDASSAAVRVVWPDGSESNFANVASNQFVIYAQP